MIYRARIVDEELTDRLAATGAVVLEGPKASGKTATARRAARSEVLLDVDENARSAIAVDPALVLDGDVPRLIDEWQLAPEIWNHVRRAIDERGLPGQFILTGSAIPADDITRHTGAGRITRLTMRPLSLQEAGVSSGEISLRALLDGEPARAVDDSLDVAALAGEIARGGWPGFRELPIDRAQRAVRDYLEEIRRADVSAIGARHDPARVGRVLQSLARNVGTHAAATTLAADAGGADGALKDDTVREYLDTLSRLMIVDDLPAWAPHLRSKATLRTAAKRHFVDPSLAVAALRATPAALLADLNLLGFLFESLVVRDLRVYAQAIDARVSQYRDNVGLEVDAIVKADDGRWGAFEVKLGPGHVDEAAANLSRFASKVDTSRSGSPDVLGVIVATGYGYMRDDGIAVIPVGTLGR